MAMHNVIEEAVTATYAALRESHAEFCACQNCQDDVVALALNKITPRYITGDNTLGAAVTRVMLATDQAKAELAVAVFDAMRTVAANPRHGGRTSLRDGAAVD